MGIKGRVTHWIKAFRIGKVSVQNPLSARLGFGTQRRYKTPGDFWVEVSIRNAEVNIGLVGLPLGSDPKLAVGRQIVDKEEIKRSENDISYYQ